MRLLFWLPLLLWAAWAGGESYASFFLPLYREVLDFGLWDFGVVRFWIAETHEKVFQTQVVAIRHIVLGGRVLPSGFTVDASTPIYTALVHPIVLFGAALVWPGLTRSQRLARLALSVPLLCLLEALDVPLVLASSIRDLLSFSVTPLADHDSKLVDWVHVMDGGGRIVLCIAAAVVVAALHGWLQRGRITE